jgi:glycosyltransferase involved in cell wall biosynthesis
MSEPIRVWFDGLVFENPYQIGIWRVFYEVLSRIAGHADCTLWLRSEPVQPLPPGVRVIRDRGRWTVNRWDLVGRARRKWANRSPARPPRPPAVFHSTYFTPCPDPAVPAVVTVYDMIAERMYPINGAWAPRDCDVKREAILAARACIAISEAAAADLRLFHPQAADRVRVIPLGADHLTRAEPGPAGPPFALFVGARGSYKNFHTVLDALRHPAWPRDLRLHVVGAPLANHEQKLVEVLGLGDRVRPLGRLTDAQLAAAYAAARCFVFPSLLEGFGLPVLEAQVNGCPCVLSDLPVFREVAGDAARFFDPRLGERLAEAVAAADEPETRRRLIDAGRANVRRFSWDRTADQTLAVYEEVARMKAP